MKKQTYLFQKFQKKYFFFQKSFFDFLYWRSIKNCDLSAHNPKNASLAPNIYPCELEKMSFYDRWKKPELQKIESSFQNSKKELKQNSSILLSAFDCNSSFANDKKKRLSSSFKKSSNVLTNQKFHFLFLKKRKEKALKRKEKKRRNENFLSKNSSFEVYQSINTFDSKKIGEFFPRGTAKKNFIQYWIFPFLGVLFFFSQNVVFSSFSKNEKLQNFSSFSPFHIQNLPDVSPLNSNAIQKHFFPSQRSNQNKNQFFEFSFPQRTSKETDFSQTLEKTEYEEIFQFYNQILKNTISVFPFGKNERKQNSFSIVSEKTFSSAASSFVEQPIFQISEKFQKKLERKRNSLSWQWFSFDSNLLNSKIFLLVSSFQIPQKAEFFLSSSNQFFEKRDSFLSLSPFQDVNFSNFQIFPRKPSTPLFDYSKSLFLVDEQKRNLSFFVASDGFLNLSDSSGKESFLFKRTQENFSSFINTSEMQKFLKNGSSFALKEKEPFLFDSKNQTTKNFVFLDKWAKTQNFSVLKNEGVVQNTNQSFFSGSPENFLSENKKNQLQKQQNLDFLFFQKFFKKIKFQNFEKKLQIQKVLKKERTYKKFSQFKKYSYDFFAFQYSKKNYKKLYNSFCLQKKGKSRVHSLFHQSGNFLTDISLPTSPLTWKPGGVREAKRGNLNLLPFFYGELQKSEHFSHFVSKGAKKEKSTILNLTRPILFQFFPNGKNSPKIKAFFDKAFQQSPKPEFQTNFNVFSQNISLQHHDFSFFFHPQPKSNFLFIEQKKSSPHFFSFYFKKFSFFENLRDKFFQKNLKNLFFDFYNIENFQKAFLFETDQQQNSPLLFQKKKNIWANFPFETKKNGQKEQDFQKEKKKIKNFLKNSFSRKYEFKKKKLSVFYSKKQKKGISSRFSGSSKKHRKFEKIFRAFFSPLKNTKNSLFFGHSEKERVLETKQFAKTKKDVFLLQSLSVFMKKNAKQTLFFIPTQKKGLKQNTKNKKHDKISEKFQNSPKTIRFSPELVFKRNGFVFVTSTQKKSNKKSIPFQRLEKEKIFQKKRRLKKEKLETRRRKKRKRFFPRPLWLRMNFYKKFLKNRHSEKRFSLLPEKNKKENSYFYSNLTPWTKSWQRKKMTLLPISPTKNEWVEKQIRNQKTEQKQLNRYFVEKYQQKDNIFKTTSDFQIYDIDSVFLKKQNLTFQKKTSQKNFQKESWMEKKILPGKSLSLNFGICGAAQKENLFSSSQTTANPGIGVQESEKVSKTIGHYQISNEIFHEFLRFSWKSSWFQNNLKSYTRTIEKNFENMQSNESKKTLSYLFDFTHPTSQSSGLKTEKKKNFLFFFHGFPNFLEQSQNDFLLRKSVFQKFSWYSNVQNSFSREPHQLSKDKENLLFLGTEKRRNISEYNQILYLRISEVLKKFKFSENMANESFFEIFKGNRRKNEKIFSGAQSGLNASFFTKTALFFEKFQIPSQPILPAFSLFSSLFNDFSIKPTGEMPTLRALWAFQKTNCSHFQNRNVYQNFWAFKKRKDAFHSFKGTKQIMNFLRKSNGFEKFQAPEKFSADGAVFEKGEKETKNTFKDKAQNSNAIQILSETKFNSLGLLDTMTLKKFQTVEKKSSLFGIQGLKQNSKISYRYLKFSLSSPFQNQNKGQMVFPKFLKNQNKQNSAKSSLNFWWAQRPFQAFDFLGTSQFRNFSELSIEKYNNNETLFVSNISFLIFGAFFFHFAVFYTLFKIPEIRSLSKFVFLLFSKFLQSFFQVFFSIYNIFQEYTQNSLNLFQNSSSFQGSLKTQKRDTKQNTMLFSSGFLSESFFSTKECQKEINFQTYIFYSTDQNSLQFKKNNFPKNTKFDVFLFEFFPRFCISSTGMDSGFQKGKRNFLHFSEKQKNFFSQVAQNKKGKIFHAGGSKIEKNLFQFSLCFLIFGKNILFVPYSLFKIASSISTKVFEIFENIFYAFYKFLEKPAEFMIEFIAFVFLIEWSSDILGFFPESIETSAWKSSQKLLRPVRSGTFFLSFGVFFLGSSSRNFVKSSQLIFQTGQNFSFFNPFHFFVSTGFLQFSNFAAYVLQKRLFSTFEKFPSILLQPDIDILVRQRKGIIFWDIWAEILLRAAEKYNVNLPSFVTLKEEQEIFIEKLVQDSQFFENTNAFARNSRSSSQGPETENFQKSFMFFLQNFHLQNQPSSFFDFSFSQQFHAIQSLRPGNNEKFRRFFLSNLFNSEKHKNIGGVQNFFNIENTISKTSFLKQSAKNTVPSLFPFFDNLEFLRTFDQLFVEKSFESFQNPLSLSQKIDRWECSQYSTFQSQETDFFLDIYPPKSLKHVHFLKYYEPVHSTLGPLICQIYAGIFPKQISKNILVVGESGTAKTFFLRALAGETEMKIITENASRYAIVQRGVAVGMKYLRDVFDAIALQTPCFFVMEDLHIIGSKRPFMISENEKSQTTQFSFGLEQQEVHETNQMIYQSTRHLVSDFRRPYKGDFSVGIPTNSFLHTFYSRAAKRDESSFFYSLGKGHKFQNSQFFGGNFSSNIWHSLSSPLPIDSLEASLENQSLQENNSSSTSTGMSKSLTGSTVSSVQKFAKKIQSSLQFSKEQIFAPPATSPFTVLLMKEQKKFKPKKRVQEISWGGLSADQILLYEKENSSIRAKIAVLAEKTMNLSQGKFDMITDLLVIIDNVRSNRGFVVFGTTHKPSFLDPALRRPGRFDETLSFPKNPNFLSRFEIFKIHFENSVSTMNFFDSSILTENFSETDLFDILSQTKLSLFHNYKFAFQKNKGSFFPQQNSFQVDMQHAHLPTLKRNEKTTVKKQLYSQTNPTKAFHAILKSPVFEDFYSLLWRRQNKFWSDSFAIPDQNQKDGTNKKQKNGGKQTFEFSLRNSNIFSNQRYTILPNGPSHLLSLAYSKLGIFIAESNLLNDPSSFSPLSLDIEKNFSKYSNFMHFSKNIFYDSWSGPKKQRNFQLQVFLSGKISEFLVSSFSQQSLIQSANGFFSPQSAGKDTCRAFYDGNGTLSSRGQPPFLKENFSFFPQNSQLSQKYFSLHSDFFFTKLGFYENSYNKENVLNKNFFQGQNSFQNFFFTKIHFPEKQQSFAENQKRLFQGEKDFYWTVFGNDESWRSATPFLFSLIQKRFLFTKNLLLSKMLFFENMDQRRKPPNPPASSILMPSKKYENFKRTEMDFFQKAHFSIHEKIQIHQKQRFLKQLYNIPVQKYFRSEFRKNQKTLFSSSFKEFAYLDAFVQKPSSSSSYYKKYIQVRHRFSNVNQWWNGMFPEHTRETTYLSDVDWRTMFLSSSDGPHAKERTTKQQSGFLHRGEVSKKSSSETIEFLMDFPDTEQYYNPRNRKWFFSAFPSSQNQPHSGSRNMSNSDFQRNQHFSKSSTFWTIFEKDLQYEIFSHFFMESFSQSFADFEKKREMLDFFAFRFLSKGFLKEFDFLTIYSRF